MIYILFRSFICAAQIWPQNGTGNSPVFLWQHLIRPVHIPKLPYRRSAPMSLPESTSPHTLVAHHGDYLDWHRGRPAYALWAIDADTPAIQTQVAQFQGELASLLLPGYVRQPHITLSVCGFPCAGDPVYDDDFPRRRLNAQLEALYISKIPSFTLHTNTADTFLAAPYLAVADPEGQIAHLRQRLEACHPEPDRNLDYCPHITLGLYAAAHPLPKVQACLATPAFVELTLEVSYLCLMHYKPNIIGGRLTEAARFHLGSSSLIETHPNTLNQLFTERAPSQSY